MSHVSVSYLGIGSMGEFLSSRVFLSSGYQLGFSALLISLEFFPHTCNNSSKAVNDVLVGLSFGNYCRESF
jgi:hypothetical protein